MGELFNAVRNEGLARPQRLKRVVLVTGGRDFGAYADERQQICEALVKLRPDIVAHGACETGADEVVDDWATRNDVPCLSWPAKWAEHDKRAGPIRNSAMVNFVDALSDKFLVIVLACPGGAGTHDCANKAGRKGLDVRSLEAVLNG